MESTKKYEIHLAPLQGYTDQIYRNTYDRFFGDADVYYTPFIRLEGEKFRNKDVRELDGNTVPILVPQILPGTPDEFRRLTDLVAGHGYKRVDINLGCPFPMIAGKKRGAGMLPYPELVKDILSVINEYPDLSFSLKMRLGWESVSECVELLNILNDLRLCHIAVHARTGKQQYKGITNPDAFEFFYQSCKHPLFYNGDLNTVQDIQGVLIRFEQLRGVMLGRGLLSSPFLIKDFYQNEMLSPAVRLAQLKDFHKALFDSYAAHLQGDSQLLTKMKALWDYFLPETDRKLLKRIKKANKLKDYEMAVNEIFCSR